MASQGHKDRMFTITVLSLLTALSLYLAIALKCNEIYLKMKNKTKKIYFLFVFPFSLSFFFQHTVLCGLPFQVFFFFFSLPSVYLNLNVGFIHLMAYSRFFTFVF